MTYRQEFESLLTQLRKDQYQLEDDSLAPELDQVARKTLDGFINVLTAAKVCRDAQKAYFKARKVNLPAHVHLDDSRKAEKNLDALVTFWTNELAPPTQQTSLF